MSAFLGFIQVDYTHVLENCILFFGGIYFAKSKFMEQMKDKIKKYTLFIGILSALLPFIVYYWLHSLDFIFTQVILLSIWESFTAITVAIGSVSYLSLVIRKQSPKLRHIENLSYTIYVIHIVFVVLFQILLENVTRNPILKFFIVSICSIVVSIISAYLLDLITKTISNIVFIRKKTSIT